MRIMLAQSPGGSFSTPSYRDADAEDCLHATCRSNLEYAAEGVGAPLHAPQTVALTFYRLVEALAVVTNLEQELRRSYL